MGVGFVLRYLAHEGGCKGVVEGDAGWFFKYGEVYI
jgi:hypothetical protein